MMEMETSVREGKGLIKLVIITTPLNLENTVDSRYLDLAYLE